jgi:hypothetical protein
MGYCSIHDKETGHQERDVTATNIPVQVIDSTSTWGTEFFFLFDGFIAS